jgi:hypothetical protein
VDKQRSQCVGEVVLNEWNENNQSCNFRTVLGPAGRNRGLGTEATRLIIGYGFERLGLHRISLEVYSFNPRARRVYEKVGFVAEGMLRYNGDWVDATVMSILADEWAGHRGHPTRSVGSGPSPRRPAGARINPRWGPTIASRPVPPAMTGQDANLPVASNPPVAVASPAERRT